WQGEAKGEGIEGVKRAPLQEGEGEICQGVEADDLGAEPTPQLREQEKRPGGQSAAKGKRWPLRRARAESPRTRPRWEYGGDVEIRRLVRSGTAREGLRRDRMR